MLVGESRSVRIGTDLDPRALTVVRDVTELDRAEAGLRASEARFRQVFDEAAIPLALLDAGGRVRLANPCMAALLDLDREGLTARSFAELFPEAGGGLQVRRGPRGGTVQVRCTPIPGAGGEAAGTLAQVLGPAIPSGEPAIRP